MESASTFWQGLFESPPDWQTLLLALLSAFILAWIAARVTRKLIRRGLQSLVSDTIATSSPLVRGPLRLIAVAVFFLVLALITSPILELSGLRPRTGVRLSQLTAWAFGSGLRILLIAALAYALIRIVTLMVRRFEHEMNRGTTLDAMERGKRARTLGTLVRNGSSALIGGVATLMVLRELGVDIAPVLAGAGVIGIAIGFGAQTLVRDIISGFFLILENQVRVGDVAAINGQGGLVEAINLRTIVLRDFEGTVHVFPNGAITTLANRSKDFSFYVIDLAVTYGEDPDRVTAIVRTIGAELQADDRFGPNILGPIEVVGVDAFGESSVTIKLRIKTVPLKQWEVGRELRRRILKAFRDNGIDFPFPRRVVKQVVPSGAPSSPRPDPD
ncbi:MAG TPA: mechanosensitive ion channel family protein [Vicinamibacterales bacterium]